MVVTLLRGKGSGFRLSDLNNHLIKFGSVGNTQSDKNKIQF
jgi:hypothetical protein